MRDLRRRGLAAVLIGTAAAGMLVVSAGTASAGAWFYTREYWPGNDLGLAYCQNAGQTDVMNSGGDIINYNCEYNDDTLNWELYEFEA